MHLVRCVPLSQSGPAPIVLGEFAAWLYRTLGPAALAVSVALSAEGRLGQTQPEGAEQPASLKLPVLLLVQRPVQR